MKKHSITIGGREFPLAFTLHTMIRMEREIEGFDFANIMELVRKPAGMLDMLYCLAETGAALDGGQLDVDREWMSLRIPVSLKKMSEMQVEIMETLSDGMSMETDTEDDEEVDVVLEEIKKKEAAES